MSDTKTRVLFVCLGNSCRSPISEAVFQKMVNDRHMTEQWEIDSAAIADWNVGYEPSSRALVILNKYNVPYNGIGRQITPEDFHKFDYIFGMDESNLRYLTELAPPGSKAKISLFGNFDPQGERIIRDPYFDADDSGFEKCYQQAVRCSQGFLDYLNKL